MSSTLKHKREINRRLTNQTFILQSSRDESEDVTATDVSVIRSGPTEPPASCKTAMQIMNDIIVCVCVRHTEDLFFIFCPFLLIRSVFRCQPVQTLSIRI